MRWRLIGGGLAICIVGSVAAGAAALAAGPAALIQPSAIPKFTVSVPTINAVHSTIDEATLRDILSGNLIGHADALATLNADSISIPEVDIAYAVTNSDGKPVSGETALHDIVLSSVANGVASTVSVGSVSLTTSLGGVGSFGKISAEAFNLGELLGFYGLVKGDASTAPQTLYRNFQAASGSVKSPEGGCEIGSFSVAEVKARPLKMSFADFAKLAGETGKGDQTLPPADTAKMIAFVADLTSAIQVSPIEFAGFQCSGSDDKGKPISVNVGKVVFGAFSGPRYPDVTVQQMSIIAPGDGSMSLGTFHFKGIDFSGPLATLQAAGDAVDEDWFQDHYRELIPSFAGFGMSSLNVDIPDEENPGERIQASVGDFDLSLQDYVNGIPTNVTSEAKDIVASIPDDTSDDFAKALIGVGIDKFDIGYDVGLKWDEPSQEIRLDHLSVTGDKLGALAVTSVIGNATRDLFSEDTDVAIGAAQSLTVKRVTVDMNDAGLSDILVQAFAKRAGQDVQTFRDAMAGVTEGTMMVFLGGAANVQDVTKAVGDFINGAKSLSVKLTAKDPAGISLEDLSELQDNPTAAVGKVDIEAHAQ